MSSMNDLRRSTHKAPQEALDAVLRKVREGGLVGDAARVAADAHVPTLAWKHTQAQNTKRAKTKGHE